MANIILFEVITLTHLRQLLLPVCHSTACWHHVSRKGIYLGMHPISDQHYIQYPALDLTISGASDLYNISQKATGTTTVIIIISFKSQCKYRYISIELYSIF
jgi:hypothetical protein